MATHTSTSSPVGDRLQYPEVDLDGDLQPRLPSRAALYLGNNYDKIQRLLQASLYHKVASSLNTQVLKQSVPAPQRLLV